jgi:hypothetical protein
MSPKPVVPKMVCLHRVRGLLANCRYLARPSAQFVCRRRVPTVVCPHPRWKHTGLKKSAWKYALHKVSSALSLMPPSPMEGASREVGAQRPVSLGLGELASAFAVLDVVEGDEQTVVTPAVFLSAIDRQRSLVLSLISNAVVMSTQP